MPVVSALAVTLFTPAAEGLRDWLLNRSTTVRGVVELNGDRVAGAKVAVDDEQAVVTDANGTFELSGVSFGEHDLSVISANAYPATGRLKVTRDPDPLPPVTVNLRPLFVPTGGAASEQEFAGFSEGFRSRWTVALWIESDKKIARQIRSVTYALPGKLGLGPIRSKRRNANFCVERTFVTEPGLQLNPIKFTARFRDGRIVKYTPFDLDELEDSPHAARCP